MFTPIQHPTYLLWPGTEGALGATGGADDNLTSEWLDVSAWGDKKIAWEIDSGGVVDADIDIDISSQHYYELNNKTATTEDYETVNIVTAHTGTVYYSVDSDDVDELQRPIRSLRVKISNDQAEPITGFRVWVEGAA